MVWFVTVMKIQLCIFEVFDLLENTLWGCLGQLFTGLDLMVISIA